MEIISEDIKKRISDTLKEKYAKGIIKKKFNEKNSMWKGKDVTIESVHGWIKRRKPKPSCCENCEKETNYLDLANISNKYKRDIKDYSWLCRSCHMKLDGRLNKLLENSKNHKREKVLFKLACDFCGESFFVNKYQILKRKTCSKKCMGGMRKKYKVFYGNQHV